MAEFRVLLNDIDIPDIELWETYVANGGYAAAEIALRRRASREVLDLIDQSGLQDRGGDWYPVATRWRRHCRTLPQLRPRPIPRPRSIPTIRTTCDRSPRSLQQESACRGTTV